jgi:hypothetical protein
MTLVSMPPLSGYTSGMSKTLWISQRFQRNERGHYTVTGDCGAERILVEIDPAVIPDQAVRPEKGLATMRARIQAAARQKWEAGEASPVFFAHSGRMQHHLISLTADDL